MNPLPSITMVGTYFGTWPRWMPAFLRSCETNSALQWIVLTDCEPPRHVPENVQFKIVRLSELNRRNSEILGMRITKPAYAQCDLRPAYGVVYAEFVGDATFWGHYDFDVIWGDLERYLRGIRLDDYSIISPRKGCLAGHFTLYRNGPANELFRRIDGYRAMLESPNHKIFDESVMSRFLQQNPDVPVYWKKKAVVCQRELDRRPHGWEWHNGKLINRRDGSERPYMHFTYWKNSMSNIDFDFGDQPDRFRITWRGVYSRPMPLVNRLLEHRPSPARIYRSWRDRVRTLVTGRGSSLFPD